jgi:DNA-binding NarL/FixJ family response regulator
MRHIPCLLIDDDPEEHEIFLMAIEGKFDINLCSYATDIFSAISAYKRTKLSQPEVIFVDWSVIKADPAANLDLLRSAFPIAADRIVLLSGQVPLLDGQRLGIYQIIRKQFSIEQYGKLIAQALAADSAFLASSF